MATTIEPRQDPSRGVHHNLPTHAGGTAQAELVHYIRVGPADSGMVQAYHFPRLANGQFSRTLQPYSGLPVPFWGPHLAMDFPPVNNNVNDSGSSQYMQPSPSSSERAPKRESRNAAPLSVSKSRPKKPKKET